MPDVAIIIPSYRSMPSILITLHGVLAEIATVPQSVELLVVDSSDDDTPQQIQTQFPNVPLMHLQQQTYPGGARNRGIEATTAPLIVFIDADAYPRGTGWLARIIEQHQQHPNYAGIGGSIDNGRANTVSQVAHLLEFSGYTSSWPARKARVVPTCNLSFKRTALGAARFLEHTWGIEDVELVDALTRQGQIIWFDPAISVFHLSKSEVRPLLTQQMKLGESTARVRRAYDLPGSWLARVPLAWLLCPWIKTVILWKRALTHERGAAKLLLLQAPLITLALLAWTEGFRRGLHGPPLERHR